MHADTWQGALVMSTYPCPFCCQPLLALQGHLTFRGDVHTAPSLLSKPSCSQWFLLLPAQEPEGGIVSHLHQLSHLCPSQSCPDLAGCWLKGGGLTPSVPGPLLAVTIVSRLSQILFPHLFYHVSYCRPIMEDQEYRGAQVCFCANTHGPGRVSRSVLPWGL